MVIDASIAASWLLPDETVGTPLEALGSSELYAPSLFWAEMRNIPVVLERRKRPTVDTLSEALSILDAMVVNFDNAPDGSRVMQLARSHQLTVHDALYVELALRLQTPFLTLDRKLAAAAQREGVHVRQGGRTVSRGSQVWLCFVISWHERWQDLCLLKSVLIPAAAGQRSVARLSFW